MYCHRLRIFTVYEDSVAENIVSNRLANEVILIIIIQPMTIANTQQIGTTYVQIMARADTNEHFYTNSYEFHLMDKQFCQNGSMLTFGFGTNTNKWSRLFTIGVGYFTLVCFTLLATEVLRNVDVLRYEKYYCQGLLLAKFRCYNVIVLLVRFYVFLDDTLSESLQNNYKIVIWIDMIFILALFVIFQWFMNQLLVRLCSISDTINDQQKYIKQRDN